MPTGTKAVICIGSHDIAAHIQLTPAGKRCGLCNVPERRAASRHIASAAGQKELQASLR